MPAYSRILLPWDSQPQEAVGPNLGAPWSEKLWGQSNLAAFAHNGWVNMALGTGRVENAPSIVGTVSYGVSPIGVGQQTALSGRNGRGYTGPTTSLTTFTVAAYVVFTSTAGGVEVITGNDDANNGGWRLQRNGGTNLQLTRIGWTNVTLASGVLQNNTPYFIGVARNDVALTVHYVVRNLQNGSVASGSVADISAWTAPTSGVWPVGYGRATTESVGGIISGAFISAYDATLGELLEWANNPWQLFAPRSIWVPVSVGGGGASTITAATGTSTASTLTGASTAASTPTAAAGTATASTVAASSTAASAITSAPGAATASTLTGSAFVAGAMTAAPGVGTGETLVGTTLAAGSAAIVAADGVATTATLGGSSVAAADIGVAAGVATASVMAEPGAVTQVTRLFAGGFPRRDQFRKGYIIKGKRYWLTDDELSVMVAQMLSEVSRGDIKQVTAGKPKPISKRTWDAIRVEARIEAVAKQFDDTDEDEDESILMMI